MCRRCVFWIERVPTAEAPLTGVEAPAAPVRRVVVSPGVPPKVTLRNAFPGVRIDRIGNGALAAVGLRAGDILLELDGISLVHHEYANDLLRESSQAESSYVLLVV